MYTPQTEEEKTFLQTYDPSAYERPSVSTDIVIFTVVNGRLCVLLVKRTEYPYKGAWSLPGGFVGISEQAEDTVRRKLLEKTGLSDIPFRQLASFSRVDRDPRMRVISIAYTAFVPSHLLCPSDTGSREGLTLFEVRSGDEGLGFVSPGVAFGEERIAFDHSEIIASALERLRNRIQYTDDALDLVDRKGFTIAELKKVYDAVLGKKMDLANFNRFFKNRYLDTGRAVTTGEKRQEGAGRPATVYKITEEEEK